MEDALTQFIKDVKDKRTKGIDEEQIFKEFIEEIEKLILASRFDASEVIIKILENLTDEGKIIDPSLLDRDINIWRWCTIAFWQINDYVSADRVIEACYLHLLRLQRKNNKKYHKGTPLQTRSVYP